MRTTAVNMHVSVVVSSFNQGALVREAVESVQCQTLRAHVVVVDDGSTDSHSLDVLAELAHQGVRVIRQANAGVGAARNTGIRAVQTDFVAVLDGDDRLQPGFLMATVNELTDDDCVAASSWLTMFGTATGVVRPTGGRVVDFLSRNSCPAPAVFRRADWESAGGYAEDMREGFEDWDFFLRLLTVGGRIAIVPEAFIDYRTHPASTNLESMNHRLRLYGEIIDRHHALFAEHMKDVLLKQESTSMERLARWEQLVLADPSVDAGNASFGDGGMAAVVRIAHERHLNTEPDQI